VVLNKPILPGQGALHACFDDMRRDPRDDLDEAESRTPARMPHGIAAGPAQRGVPENCGLGQR
jgi:hypothetical protein